MDFIIGMPKVKGMGLVFVVVDWFLKYTVFMSAPSTWTAEVVTNLLYRNAVKYFGLPEDIVSDRNSHFIGRFWTVLFRLLGSQLKLGSPTNKWSDWEDQRCVGKLLQALCDCKSKKLVGLVGFSI